MAGLKEIKRRLASVRNTKKITYAMKLVAAAKLRKVQDDVGSLKRYKRALEESFARALAELPAIELNTPLTEVREVRRIRLLVIGGFRGLAGGYNTNVNKALERVLEDLRRSNSPEVLVTVIGKKPLDYIRRRGLRVTQYYDKLPDSVASWPIEQVVSELVREFENREVDRTILLFTEFASALSQTTRVSDLLPVMVAVNTVDESTSKENIVEPTPIDAYRALLPRLLRADVQYAALNAQASEHGSRMTAMDAATKNADDLAGRLRRTYNKLRQSSITAELLDIIGGAEAVS